MAGTLEQRYALRDKIAAGAAGTVWRALDRVTGEVVAVKILHQEVVRERDVVAAFREEGAVLAELDHPGVVRPREFIAVDGELALVMDLVEGTDLRRLVAAGGPLAPATAAAVLAQVAEALAAVHAAGIVHGDVKPGNILVPEPAGSPGVRLADFGVAHRIQRPTGATHATPEYVAPEVVDGEPPLPASDVYAAGIVLYEVLTCRGPFRGGSVDDVLRRHRECVAARLPGMSDELWRVIESCLEVDPRQRPSAAELAATLRAVEPVLVGVPPAPLNLTAPTLRRRDQGPRSGTDGIGPVWPDAPANPAAAVPAACADGFVSLDELLRPDGGDGSDGTGPAASGVAVSNAAVSGAVVSGVAVSGVAVSGVAVPATPAPAEQPAPWATPARPDRRPRRSRLSLVLGLAAGVALLAALTFGGWAVIAGRGGPEPVADLHRKPTASHPARPHARPTPSSPASPAPSVKKSPTVGDDNADGEGDGTGTGDGTQDQGDLPGAGDQDGGDQVGGDVPGFGDPMPTMPGGRDH